MGFDWTSIGTGSTIRVTEFNEFKTNVDTLYGDLELDAPSWTYLPVAASDVGIEGILKEVRTKTDYADDMNSCRNDNVSHDATVDTGDDVTDHATYDGTVDTGDETGVDNSYDVDYKATYDFGVDATNNGSYDSDDNYNVYATHRATVNDAENTTYNSSYLTEFV